MLKFIIISLISISLHAANYYPVGKTGANTSYSKQSDCETQESQKCFDITGRTTEYLSVLNDQLVEDTTKKLEYLQRVEEDNQKRKTQRAHLREKFFGEYIKDEILKDLKSKDLSSADAKEVLDLFTQVFVFLKHGLIKHANSKIATLTLTANTISTTQRTQLMTEMTNFLGI